MRSRNSKTDPLENHLATLVEFIQRYREADVGIFRKGIGCAGNRTAALLITSAELGVLTTTLNTCMTRRWIISTHSLICHTIARNGQITPITDGVTPWLYVQACTVRPRHHSRLAGPLSHQSAT